jgi:hypothetical protein
MQLGHHKGVPALQLRHCEDLSALQLRHYKELLAVQLRHSEDLPALPLVRGMEVLLTLSPSNKLALWKLRVLVRKPRAERLRVQKEQALLTQASNSRTGAQQVRGLSLQVKQIPRDSTEERLHG